MTQEEIKKAAAEYASIRYYDAIIRQNIAAAYSAGATMADNAAKDRIKELEDALQEAVNQLEYLNAKFPETGTTNSILSRLAQVINK